MPTKKTLASMIAALTVICGLLTAVPALAGSTEEVPRLPLCFRRCFGVE
jgi:hypothetical protein